MGYRSLMVTAVVLLLHGCGGSGFEAGATGGTGGSAAGGAGGGADAGVGGTSIGGTAGDSGADAIAEAGSADAIADAIAEASDDAIAEASDDASIDSGVQPIAVVQASETTLSLPPQAVSTLAMPSTPVAGNAIIVGITCISDHGYDGDAGVAGDCILSNGSVTDNRGNTYTRVVQGEPIKSSHQGARSYIFIAGNVGASSGSFVISVDPAGSSTVQAIAWGAIEVQGLKAPPSLDVWGISLVGGTDATSTTAATDVATSQPNELAVGVLSMRSNDTNMLITPEATWVSHHLHQNATDANQNPPGHSMVSKVLSGTGEVSHTWTHDAPSRGVAAVVATFKGAAQN